MNSVEIIEGVIASRINKNILSGSQIPCLDRGIDSILISGLWQRHCDDGVKKHAWVHDVQNGWGQDGDNPNH